MEGALVRGATAGDVFELTPSDAQPLGPIEFNLMAYVFDEILRVEGTLSSQFELECTRCLEKFSFDLVIDNYNTEIEIENRGIVDLTDRIREDILLSLPVYPHCDAFSDERVCPVGNRFTAVPEKIVDDEDSSSEGKPSSSRENDVWSALDTWKQDDKT